MYFKYEAKNNKINIKCIDLTGTIVNFITKVKVFNYINNIYILIGEYEVVDGEAIFDYKELVTNSLYIDTYHEDNLYKSKIKINYYNSNKTINYKISYTTSLGSRLTSTTFLRRTSLGLPSWSSAYKHDISNFSKLFYPIYTLTERKFFKFREHLLNNIYSKKRRRLISTSKPILAVNDIDHNSIAITHIREKEMITDITKTPLNIIAPTLLKGDLDTTFPIKLDKVFNKLFLKSDRSCILRISGTNQKRLPISEDVFCDGVVSTSTFNEYSTITDIYIRLTNGSEDPNITWTNYLECSGSSLNFRTDFNVSYDFNKQKDYDTPLYLYNNKNNTLNSFYGDKWTEYVDYEDSYSFTQADKIFVTDTQDVVFLADTVSLNTEKDDNVLNENGENVYIDNKEVSITQLRKNIESPIKLYSSNNNNTVVTITEDNLVEDGTVEFQINPRDLIDQLGNIQVEVILEIDGFKYYLDSTKNFSTDNTSFILSNKNPIYISYNTNSISYISLILKFDTQVYQASVIKNILDIKNTHISGLDMYHNGTNLILKTVTGYYKLDLNKNYATLETDTTVDIQTEKSVVITNTEGFKDGNNTN